LRAIFTSTKGINNVPLAEVVGIRSQKRKGITIVFNGNKQFWALTTNLAPKENVKGFSFPHQHSKPLGCCENFSLSMKKVFNIDVEMSP
jgi:hypothetical protein